ncbi:hypothetical protein LXA43DRAFT_1099663 [Ganoderma leucocontextum]|nr:hypothetical protein LXA43DRAFT_1099663 [Ganoderma leucocontextum]
MEPAAMQFNDTRYKHFLYRARVAEDAHLEVTSLRGTPIIAIVSQIETERMPPVNWTLVMCKEADGEIIFSNAMRKDWSFERMDATGVCLKTQCRVDSDCHHKVCLEFDSTSFATLFHEQVKGAVEGGKIASEWDDTVEELVDGLLSLVSETVEMDSMPRAPVSLTVLEGEIGVRHPYRELGTSEPPSNLAFGRESVGLSHRCSPPMRSRAAPGWWGWRRRSRPIPPTSGHVQDPDAPSRPVAVQTSQLYGPGAPDVLQTATSSAHEDAGGEANSGRSSISSSADDQSTHDARRRFGVQLARGSSIRSHCRET